VRVTSGAAVAELAAGSPYRAYVYAYPHKTAYRALRPPPPLWEVWAGERRDALFLYLHVPFCEMRCGFCNLFTQSLPVAELPDAYLDALARQAAVVRDALGDGTGYARAAVGGGTPTYLDTGQLDRLFDIAEGVLGAQLGSIPMSVETSPATATADRLRVLRERGATRVSIGVQSFLDVENRQVGRPQGRSEVERGLTAIRAAGVPVLNIDLMYGIPGQTGATWRASLDAALSHRPEELYLYPLYVRPLTGLGRRHNGARLTGGPAQVPRTPWDEQRLRLYGEGREHLLAAGYEQVSMRMFRLPGAGTGTGAEPSYCCQDDGMVGLGSGARSYTTALHYSFDYAVGSASVKPIVADYLRHSADGFATAEIGFRLNADDQRRRWLLKSLLRAEGVDLPAYRRRFGTGLADDFPQLARLGELGWLEAVGPDGVLRLTAEGLAFSDTIGPWLFSDRVRAAMDAWEPR
jgi:coproporphyrinogen III oxidase-like Fe-S oxidoreductase